MNTELQLQKHSAVQSHRLTRCSYTPTWITALQQSQHQ